jgi:acyl-CoA thioester hydrolase
VSEFVWPVRVYYEDTDSGGVVYYANYLRFMERARTEWLRSIGYEQDSLAREQGIVFAVRNATMDFLKPGRFNQLLNVTVKLMQCGKATLTVAQKITSQEGANLCTAEIKLACVNGTTWTPSPIPASLLAEITRAHN